MGFELELRRVSMYLEARLVADMRGTGGADPFEADPDPGPEAEGQGLRSARPKEECIAKGNVRRPDSLASGSNAI